MSCAIFWDLENCGVPSGCSGHQVVKSIRNAIQQFGSIKVFKAYSAISEQPQTKSLGLRSELQTSGISLVDTPHNGQKDVADKMMIVDMLLYAMDNDPPATIVLISGDRDFAYTIGVLRLRQYDVVLLSPPNTHPSLRSNATLCLDWNKDVLHSGYTNVPVNLSPALTPAPISSTFRPAYRPTARYDADNLEEVTSLETYLSHQCRPSLSPATSRLEVPLPSTSRQEFQGRRSRFGSVSSMNSFTTCGSSLGHSHGEEEEWTDIGTESSADQGLSNPPSPESVVIPSPPAFVQDLDASSMTLVPPSLTSSPTTPSIETTHSSPPLPPTTLSEPRFSGPLPHQFVTLIKILQGYRERGKFTVWRPSVAAELTAADPTALHILPTPKDGSSRLFADYAELAKAWGVVDTGVNGGDSWITLLPKYHNFVA